MIYPRQELAEQIQTEEGPPNWQNEARKWALLVKSDQSNRRSARWPLAERSQAGGGLTGS